MFKIFVLLNSIILTACFECIKVLAIRIVNMTLILSSKTLNAFIKFRVYYISKLSIIKLFEL